MNNELIVQQFEEIEKKVERLIVVYQSQEETNLKLRNRIEELEKEIRNKVEIEKSYQEARTLIRSKIDSLLVKLEDITNS